MSLQKCRRWVKSYTISVSLENKHLPRDVHNHVCQGYLSSPHNNVLPNGTTDAAGLYTFLSCHGACPDEYRYTTPHPLSFVFDLKNCTLPFPETHYNIVGKCLQMCFYRIEYI